MKIKHKLSDGTPLNSTSCRMCGKEGLEEILDLGLMPVANHYLPLDQELGTEARYPLILGWCKECSLLQLHDSLDPDLLFSDYTYISSHSLPSNRHFAETSRVLSDRYLVSSTDLVVEIGSNDGVFLRNLTPRYRVLGIDSAANVCELARAQGIEVINAFVDEEVGVSVRNECGPAKLIFAANVLAHVDNLQGLMASINHMLDDDGVLVVEVPYVENMLRDASFDQIYHEHLCYFSLHNLDHLCRQNSMMLFDVEHLSTHGGSIRAHIRKKRNHAYPVQSSVRHMLERECEIGLQHASPYHEFTHKVISMQQALSEMIQDQYRAGRKIIGYGAPAKATTLLNACGIKYPIIDYIIDTNPAKVGHQVPGTGIPILPPETLRQDPPDLVLILAWNYADYILDTESDLARDGVRFILPYPHPSII